MMAWQGITDDCAALYEARLIDENRKREIAADMAEIDLQRNIEILRKLRGKEHTRAIIEAEMEA